MREMRGSNRMAALDRVAVLTALNLAHELQQLRDDAEARDRELARTLGDMNRKLDGLFDTPAALSVARQRCDESPHTTGRRADMPSTMRALYFATSSAVFDSVRKHSPCPLITTAGAQRKRGVHVRPVAESPKASKRSHLNPGIKVVSHASPRRRTFFLRSPSLASA